MRTALFVVLLLGLAAGSRAKTPDPRDSIILESKTVAPGLSGSPAFTMKVYITNKDTVAILTLALRESTTTGGAYAPLDSTGSGDDTDGWTRADCLTFLKKTLANNPAEDFSGYNGSSPDRFLIAATFSPTGANPVRNSEPPNATRTAIWELQFMGTSKAVGKVRLDTTRLAQSTGMTVIRNNGQMVQDVPVNFVPGVITVEAPKKGELNPGFERLSTFGLLQRNCWPPLTESPAGPGFCGPFRGGRTGAADGAFELNAVFREEEFPYWNLAPPGVFVFNKFDLPAV